MMKFSRINKPGQRIFAAFAVTVAIFSVAAFGQQETVPGVVALESEAEEAIRQYAVELIIFEYTDLASAGTEAFLPDELPEATPEDEYFTVVPEDLEFGDMRETATVGPLDATGDLRPAATDFDSETEVPGEPADAIEPDISYDDIELVEIPTYERAGLKLLPREEYVLTDVYERLELLDAYLPIMHTAWTQPTLEKDDTAPIALRRLGNPPLRLEGSISLYLSRFLHLVVDLSLEERSPIRGPVQDSRVRRFGDSEPRFGFDPNYLTPTVYYRIEEDRIVRNGELRYYDHPRFGVIAKISRVEEENPDPDQLAPIPNR